MTRKGGRKKKEVQSTPSGVPDEVQSAPSSSRTASEAGSQAQTSSSTRAPGNTQSMGGFGRGQGQGQSRQQPGQQQAQQQGQSLQASRSEQQSQAPAGVQGMISQGRGRGSLGGRRESLAPGTGRGQSPRPGPPLQQQQLPPGQMQGAWQAPPPGFQPQQQQQQQPMQGAWQGQSPRPGPPLQQQQLPAGQMQGAWQAPPPGFQPQQQQQQPLQGAWQGQSPRPGPPPQQQQPLQGAWQRPGESSRPQQPQQSHQTQQPRQPAWMQPRQPPTTVPQTPKKPEGSAKQMSDVESATKALAEVSLEKKQQPTSQLASSSTDVQKVAPTGAFKIPHRRDFTKAGTLGRKISVLTNMMQINFGPQFKPNVIHYDVAIEPDKPKYLLRRVFKKAQEELFPNRFPAFDGKKNAYSAGPLPFEVPRTIEVTVRNENAVEKQFKITFKEAAKLDLAWLKNVGPGLPDTERNQTCIQAIDVILRMAPVLKATPIGRSFFTPPAGRPKSLGGGMDLWVGHFQSAILGWKPFLNIDVAHKGFPTSQPVIDLMKTICGCDGQGGGGRSGRQPYGRQAYDQRPIELTVDLINQHSEEITRFLSGLKVVYQLPDKSTSRRIQRVNGLAPCPRENSFELSDGKRVTIEKYYLLDKKYTIKYPNYPCLWIGSKDRKIHVPVELCKIVEGQATQKKLNENQTSEMIRHAATGTQDRKDKIMEAYEKTRYNEDPCMKEFGISVNGEFEEIPARVLNPPVLTYKNKDVTPSKGQWRTDGIEFLQSSSSISGNNTWTILNLNYRTQDGEVYDFAKNLKIIAAGFGVKIGEPATPFRKLDTRYAQECMRKLGDYFDSQKRAGIKLVVVIIPDIKGPYCWVKQVSELNVGILTQCLKSKTLIKIQKDRSPATLTNILLKINAKLNGINHKIAEERKQLHKKLPSCLKEPCMIVGADVTHPSPDAKDIPSIAAVVASHDPLAFRYNTEIKLQDPRQEIIQELAGIMKNQLVFFHEKTGYWPFRIIFYRDGVSEGQFQQVLQQEMTAIRRACKAVEPQVGKRYEPPITFLVVQKRNHTRFFPTDLEESDDKNFNVKAGTIVDTQITHPTDIDFYLVSHASIQGTARPTKYRCLHDDANMSEDEIEQLTYYLCHMFSRCTRSVSYPTPTYYAHLAAFRARNLTHDVKIDLNNLSQEQKIKLTVRPDVLKGSPMFFV